jgi:hypothetical protein
MNVPQATSAPEGRRASAAAAGVRTATGVSIMAVMPQALIDIAVSVQPATSPEDELKPSTDTDGSVAEAAGAADANNYKQ